MKDPINFFDRIATFVYALLILLFVVSAVGLVRYTHAQRGYASQAAHQNINFSGQRHSSFNHVVFSTAGNTPSKIFLENENQNSFFWKLIFTIGLCFVLISVCTPLYLYVNYKRPAKRLIYALECLEDGKSTDWKLPKGSRTLHSLGTSVKKLAELHHYSEEFIQSIGEGNLDTSFNKIDESNRYGRMLLSMQNKLRQLSQEERNNAWINEKLAELEKIVKTESDSSRLSMQVIALITKSVSAGVGVLYGINDEDPDATFFYPIGSYGFYDNLKSPRHIYLGEGQLGEMGVQRKMFILKDVPKNYLVIHSGLGSANPTDVIMLPLMFKNGLYGAVELASFKPFASHEIKWLERASESLAAHFFNQKINDDAKRKLEELADKQANELVEIHRLQKQTYHALELKLKEVEEEKHKNEAILQGCVDGVISFNERGDIHFCNPVAEEIFGCPNNVILKKRIFELIPVRIDSIDKQLKPFYMSDNGEKEITVRTEATLKKFAGEDVDVLITSTRVEVQNNILFTFFLQKISVDLF